MELLHPLLIRRDRRTLHTHVVLLNGVSRVDGDLVLSLVTVGEREVVVLEVDIEVGEDELLLDQRPDHTCHLITIQLNDGVLDLDLGGGRGGEERVTGGEEDGGEVDVSGGAGGEGGGCQSSHSSAATAGKAGEHDGRKRDTRGVDLHVNKYGVGEEAV
jgi:hypothetical protein